MRQRADCGKETAWDWSIMRMSRHKKQKRDMKVHNRSAEHMISETCQAAKRAPKSHGCCQKTGIS